MIKVKRTIQLKPGKRGRRRIVVGEESTPEVAASRIPRISRLMALAIRFDRLLRDGVVADQSELARLAHVTQPRMTQIMNLLHLAPDIQEELLFLPRVEKGKDRIHEKLLRPIAAELAWGAQMRFWRSLTNFAVDSSVNGSSRFG